MINAQETHKIYPTMDRLLVERIKVVEEVTSGGIILTPGLTHKDYQPNKSQTLVAEKEIEEDENTYEAKVIAVGPTCTSIKKGDKVLLGKYTGLDLFKDRSVFLINEKDALAILK